MYILLNGVRYSCTCTPKNGYVVYKELPNNFSMPDSGDILLYSNDDFLMRTDKIENYLYKSFKDGKFTLTNSLGYIQTPEPEPAQDEPTEEDDTASMLIDHEYRLTMLELGLVE